MKIQQFYHLNQFVLTDLESKTNYFQSYDSMICKINNSDYTIEFWKNRDYSKTTLKHLYLFIKDYFWLIWTIDLKNTEVNKKLIERIIKDWYCYRRNSLSSWFIKYKVIYNEDL